MSMKPHLNLVKGLGSGTPVVFQHGLCGNAGQTSEAFPIDPRFRMHTLECRGHGASEAGSLNAFSIKAFADDVADMVEAENIASCIVGGISMGAAISLHLAVHRPELVKALVLARPAWVIQNAPVNMQPNQDIGTLLAQLPPQIAKEKFLASDMAKRLAKEAPDNLASLITFFSREPIDVTAALLTSIANDGPGVTEQQVRALKIPTLIIATAQDYVHPLSHADSLHKMISHSRLVELTPKGVDKAHYVKEFQTALLNFFEEHA